MPFPAQRRTPPSGNVRLCLNTAFSGSFPMLTGYYFFCLAMKASSFRTCSSTTLLW